MARYVPQPYPGGVTHFWPGQDRVDHPNGRTLGWRAAANEDWRQVAHEVEVHVIPGTHLTCRTTHVNTLAEHLKACLSKVQAEMSHGAGLAQIRQSARHYLLGGDPSSETLLI